MRLICGGDGSGPGRYVEKVKPDPLNLLANTIVGTHSKLNLTSDHGRRDTMYGAFFMPALHDPCPFTIWKQRLLLYRYRKDET